MLLDCSLFLDPLPSIKQRKKGLMRKIKHISSKTKISKWTSMCALCLVSRLCPTLHDPMDCSPPGSSVHGDSPGKNTGVGCHALLQGVFPTQGLNPGLPDSLPSEPPGKPTWTCIVFCKKLGDTVTRVYVICKRAFQRSQCFTNQELMYSRHTWGKPIV